MITGITVSSVKRVRRREVYNNQEDDEMFERFEPLTLNMDEENFTDYLRQFLCGEVDTEFYEYNKLCRGPKVTKVETVSYQENPYKPVKYHDPISSHRYGKVKKGNLVNKNNKPTSQLLNSWYGESKPEQSPNKNRICSVDDLLSDTFLDFEESEAMEISDVGDDLPEFTEDNIDLLNLLEPLHSDLFLSNHSVGQVQWNHHLDVHSKQGTGETILNDDVFNSEVESQCIQSLAKQLSMESEAFLTQGANWIQQESIPVYETLRDDHISSSSLPDPSSASSKELINLKSTDLGNDPTKLLEIGNHMNQLMLKYNKLSSLLKNPNKSAKLSSSPLEDTGCRPRTLAQDTLKQKSQTGSRICRMKRRASVEASKIYFSAIQKEQERLLYVIRVMSEKILEDSTNIQNHNQCLRLNYLIYQNLNDMVAGYQSSYIGKVLLSKANDILSRHKRVDSPTNIQT